MDPVKYLVFDADNTLLDFDLAMMRAQKAVADSIGCPFSEPYFRIGQELIDAAWEEFRMTETRDPEIQEFWHLHYRMQIVWHYEMLLKRLGMDLDPYSLMKIHFRSISETHTTMEPETLDVLKTLSRTCRIAIATNSVEETKGRLSVFEPYCVRMFLSDEVHAIKPTPAFFRAVLSGLGCRPEECLMIGDSASEDMAGAKRAGMHTCWYRRGKGNRACPDAEYSILSITELPALLECP